MRVIGVCFLDKIYSVAGESCDTTIWKGTGTTFLMNLVQMMNISLADIEIVTELSPSNITHPFIQTVLDGKADLIPIEAGMTYSRHKLVDFSGPVGYVESCIFSKKRTNQAVGNFLTKTFDIYSFGAIIVSTLLVSLTLWISQKGFENRISFGGCTLYTIGNCLAQGLPNLFKVGMSERQRLILVIHGLMLVVLAKSFSGTILASLVSQSKPSQIESLWDVAKSPSLKMITDGGTFWYEDLMNHSATAQMKDRIEMRDLLKADPVKTNEALDELFAGTHVLIGYQDYLNIILEQSDKYMEDDFHKSKPIMTRPSAIALSKSPTMISKKISLGMHWLTAFELYDQGDTGEFIEHHKDECKSKESRNCPRTPEKDRSSNIVKKHRLLALRTTKRNSAFTTKHFKLMFYIIAFGLCLSSVAFIIEIVTFKYAQNKEIQY